jgi:chitinase
VQLLDCADAEGLQSFRFSLGVPTNGSPARTTALITIVSNAVAVAAPRLHARDAVADQKDGFVLVPVLLGGPAGQTPQSGLVTVDYATRPLSATAGVDYQHVSGTLSFAPGQTVQTVAVPIVDVGDKPTRSFALDLSNPTGGGQVSDATGLVTIGARTGDETAQPTLSAPADVVVGEADGYVDLAVRLSARGSNAVSINYATSSSGGTADQGNGCPGDDYVARDGTLNFAPGETTKVVRVQLHDCSTPDDVEGLATFRFNLSGTTPSAIARSTTLVSIVDDSSPVATPRVVVRDAIVDQKDGFVRVPVLLGGTGGQVTSAPVTFDYTTVDATATAGVDYTPVSGSLRFAPGQTVKTIVVPVHDVGPKPPRSFVVSISNLVNATLSGGDGVGVVTIGASPAQPVDLPALSAPPDLAVDERDGYVDLAVSLSAPGQSPVTVDYGTFANSGANSGTTCPADYVSTNASTNGRLTFAPGETTKVVRVQVLDCDDVEGIVSFRFTLSVPANATIARPTAVVSIVDNQTAWTPNNTALPTITGVAQPGQTLTASPGAWTGAPTGFLYSWQRCDLNGAACAPIADATAATYVVTEADNAHKLRVEVRATNSLGTSLPAYSLPTAAILSLPGPPLDVFAAAGDEKAFVYFSPPANAGGAALTYTVVASPGGAFASGASSPIVVTGLTNGVTYTFTVSATNALGTGPASAPSNPVTPARRPPAPPSPPPPAPRPAVPVFSAPAGPRPLPPS